MTGFQRSSGEWAAFVAQSRTNGEWSGSGTLGYTRLAGEWVQWQAPSFDAALTKPTNLGVTADDTSALFTWTNTAIDPDFLPTDVQVRITTTTLVWSEYTYPESSWSVGFLAPSTNYLMQIRYVRREDGIVVTEGEICDLHFTTDALAGSGTPAADPGGSGSDTSIPWADTGDPGPVGGPGTWWEYIVQTADTPASGTITFADTAVTGSFDGDAGSLDINFVTEGLSCGALARLKYRENDDGVPGTYLYGDPFVMVCDWATDCGGVSDSAAWAETLYADPDVLMAMPNICIQATDPMAIEDYIVAGLTYGKLDGLLAQGVGVTGNHTLFGNSTNSTLGTPAAAGKVGALALQTNGDDFSASLTINLDAVPGSGVTDSAILARWGRNVAISAVYATATTWYPRLSYQTATGGVTLTADTAQVLGADVTITVVIDSDGDQYIYVGPDLDGTGTALGAIVLEDGGMGEDFQINLPQSAQISQVAAWGRVLTADEIGDIAGGLAGYPTVIAAEYQTNGGFINDYAPPLPAGYTSQAGDVFVMYANRAATAPTEVNGWNVHGATADSKDIMWYVSDGTETAFPTMVWGDAQNRQWIVVVMRNVNTTNPIDNVSATTNGTGNLVSPSAAEVLTPSNPASTVTWMDVGGPHTVYGLTNIIESLRSSDAFVGYRRYAHGNNPPIIDSEVAEIFNNTSSGTRQYGLIAWNPAEIEEEPSDTSPGITFVGVETNRGNSGTSLTCNVPSGTTAGDIIIVCSAGRSGTPSLDGPFTKQGQRLDYANSNAFNGINYVIAGADGEAIPSDVTVTHGLSGRLDIAVLVYRGVDPHQPFDGQYARRDRANASWGTLNTQNDGTLAVFFEWSKRNSNATLVSPILSDLNGYTARVSHLGTTGTSEVDMSISEKLVGATESMDIPTYDYSTNLSGSNWRYCILPLRGIGARTEPALNAGIGTNTNDLISCKAGDVFIWCCNLRNAGFLAPAGTVSLGGGAAHGVIENISGNLNYDTLGVSDGSAAVFAVEITTGGTISGNENNGTSNGMVVSGLDVSDGLNTAIGTVTSSFQDGSTAVAVTPDPAMGPGDTGHRQLFFYGGGGADVGTTRWTTTPAGVSVLNTDIYKLGSNGYYLGQNLNYLSTDYQETAQTADFASTALGSNGGQFVVSVEVIESGANVNYANEMSAALIIDTGNAGQAVAVNDTFTLKVNGNFRNTTWTSMLAASGNLTYFEVPTNEQLWANGTGGSGKVWANLDTEVEVGTGQIIFSGTITADNSGTAVWPAEGVVTLPTISARGYTLTPTEGSVCSEDPATEPAAIS